MKKQYLIILLLFPLCIVAQEKILLQGKITNEKDVEGIHILNRSTRFNSVTDIYGNFSITVKESDTLVFSSVHYNPLEVEITSEIFKEALLIVTLQELINELDEVFLGPDLTGNLRTDIEKIEVKDPINFQDLGIPGYTGTPQERIVPVTTALFPTSVNIEAVYKHLSGYYRKLRLRRKWDAENRAVASLIDYYNARFFQEAYNIPKNRLYDFVLFCVESTQIAQDFYAGRYEEVFKTFRDKSKLYLARMNAKEE
ncbi:MAG: carboxypeptidase-like regulatory domain-containing protein [Bacteroidia bacterium]|nr:carboxypeptidase-like regulatory domain-containing protein [Bacteroidia bacterium]NNF32041.1 hypothetical protein [Flavobacteriaceae bacterium]MBT8276492.1 carboxypeptidase-like regulatory domain-containing protein [Bacteroidia bacterium]NNJ82463.1 hypothetical protein [Flavobacteriaceae bacterium]NNK53439.1 hypothetical protein [Flavobacteriaceae bacterium]